MITVLYVRGRYLNPSYEVLFDAFERTSDPKVRAIDVSAVRIEELKSAIAASTVLAVSDVVAGLSLPRTGPFSGWSPITERPSSFYADVVAALVSAVTPTMMISFSWDLHVHGDAFPVDPRIREWSERCGALAWMWESEPTSLDQVPPSYQDSWMLSGGSTRATWERVRAAFPVRVELPFSIGASEFRESPLRPRWDVTVAGVAYATRRIAVERIRRAGLSLSPYRPIALANNAVDRMANRVPAFAASALWDARRCFAQAAQRWVVAKAPVNFVCGSGYRYPVRKFFEIPAARSAMVAYPCHGLRNFGFVDGHSVVEVEPEDAGSAARRLVANPRLTTAIATRGWETVRRLHSAEKRVSDLVAVLRRLAAGTLQGAKFIDGTFEIY